MQTLNSFDSYTFVKRCFLALSLIGSLAAGSTAMADSAIPGGRITQVSLSDLDLSTSDGQQMAQTRLLQSARRLCLQVSDGLDLSRHENYLACLAATMDKSNARLDALVAHATTIKFARNDTK